MDLQSASGNWEVELTFPDFMGIDAFIDDISTIKLYNEPDSKFEINNVDGLNVISRTFESLNKFEDWHDKVDRFIDEHDVPNVTWTANYVEVVVKESDLLRDKEGNKLKEDNIVIYNNEEYFIHDVGINDNDAAFLILCKTTAKSYTDSINSQVYVSPDEVIYTDVNKWASEDYINNYILNNFDA